jgi:hypothetical protein
MTRQRGWETNTTRLEKYDSGDGETARKKYKMAGKERMRDLKPTDGREMALARSASSVGGQIRRGPARVAGASYGSLGFGLTTGSRRGERAEGERKSCLPCLPVVFRLGGGGAAFITELSTHDLPTLY